MAPGRLFAEKPEMATYLVTTATMDQSMKPTASLCLIHGPSRSSDQPRAVMLPADQPLNHELDHSLLGASGDQIRIGK